MPAIQDSYSIHVSNRFSLSINDKEGYESDTYVDVDPLEQLRLIEEQNKQNRESKKKGKQAEPEKPVAKKEVQFKESKNANIPSKKSDSKKDDKNQHKLKGKKDSSKENEKFSSNRERQTAPGEENRRPRRQNNQRWERQAPREKGEGDQFGGRSYDEPQDRSFRKGNGNAEGEGRMDRGGNRYERYRGSRGGGFRGGSRGGSYGYRSNFRSDGRDDRGKREFDRRSGSDKSGVRPVDKRDGAGPRNWGTPGNEIDEVLEPTFENEDNTTWADQAENDGNQKSSGSDTEMKKDEAEAGDSPAEEKPPTEMTLDEWKKMQNSSFKKKQFNIRRPGEGEDGSKWKGMKVIHESTGIKPVHHHVVNDEMSRKGSSKQTIEVDIRFDTPPRGGRGGRGGRGFRGGGRGGNYRGGQRGGGGRYGNRYNQAPPPDVLNEKEFPTLPAA